MAFDAIGAVPCESAHKADVAYRTTAKLSPSVTRRLCGLRLAPRTATTTSSVTSRSDQHDHARLRLMTRFLPAARREDDLHEHCSRRLCSVGPIRLLRRAQPGPLPRPSRSDSVWQSALPLFALLAAATATTIVLRRLNGRVQTIIGAGAILVGLGITVAAIESGSTWLYLVASAVAGVGFGAGFQGPMRSMAPQAAEDQCPALLSAVFLVAYVGLGVSAVIPGALISNGAALTAVASGLAVALAVLTAPALYTATRARTAHETSVTASTAATHAVAACSSTGCSSWPSSPSRSPTTASSSGPSRPAADRRSRPVPAVSPPTKLLSARSAKTTMNTGLPDPNR